MPRLAARLGVRNAPEDAQIAFGRASHGAGRRNDYRARCDTRLRLVRTPPNVDERSEAGAGGDCRQRGEGVLRLTRRGYLVHCRMSQSRRPGVGRGDAHDSGRSCCHRDGCGRDSQQQGFVHGRFRRHGRTNTLFLRSIVAEPTIDAPFRQYRGGQRHENDRCSCRCAQPAARRALAASGPGHRTPSADSLLCQLHAPSRPFHNMGPGRNPRDGRWNPAAPPCA